MHLHLLQVHYLSNNHHHCSTPTQWSHFIPYLFFVFSYVNHVITSLFLSATQKLRSLYGHKIRIKAYSYIYSLLCYVFKLPIINRSFQYLSLIYEYSRYSFKLESVDLWFPNTHPSERFSQPDGTCAWAIHVTVYPWT